MDAYCDDSRPQTKVMEDIASEMDAWFAVSGDMDDFIYYGDTGKQHSEK